MQTKLDSTNVTKDQKVESRTMKKCILKQKRFLASAGQEKQQMLQQSPDQVKNDSTRCSNDGDELEQKSQSSSIGLDNFKLRKRIRMESEDEEIAVLCLFKLKKRLRPSAPRQQKKIEEEEKMTKKSIMDNTQCHNPQNPQITESNQIHFKLPSLSEHLILQQAMTQSTQPLLPQTLYQGFNQLQYPLAHPNQYYQSLPNQSQAFYQCYSNYIN